MPMHARAAERATNLQGLTRRPRLKVCWAYVRRIKLETLFVAVPGTVALEGHHV